MSHSRPRRSGVVWQILTLVAIAATIAYNGLSQALPIGGQTSADVSNRFPTFFTPANYAFAMNDSPKMPVTACCGSQLTRM